MTTLTLQNKLFQQLRQWGIFTSLLILGVSPGLLRGQSFVPQYKLAPYWPNYAGFEIEAADTGIVAGRDSYNLPILSAGTFAFVITNDSKYYFNGEPSVVFTLSPSPNNGQGIDFHAVSRYGDHYYLLGGQSNGVASSCTQFYTSGVPPIFRKLQPNGYISGSVEGANLFTNSSGALLETVAGWVSTGFFPVAAWWENGTFRTLANDPNGYSRAHGVSGPQTVSMYNYNQITVPAYEIVGEYGTNLFAQPHACYWFRDYYYGLTQNYYQNDIHPDGFISSRANGVGSAYYYANNGYYPGNWFVGDGIPNNSSDSHALIWDFSSSWHDVHPAGYQSSSARSTSYNLTVGVATTNGVTHAMLWAGFTPVDLHGYFPGAVDSQATGISPDGRIVGSYHIAGNAIIPFVLLPQGLPTLQVANIGGTTLVSSNDCNNFGLQNVRFSQAFVKDSGLTSFVASEPNYPNTTIVFSRAPGVTIVPRLATGEPLDDSLISAIDDYAIDESNRIHAVVRLWGESSGVEVEVQPNSSIQLVNDSGDTLPDGGTIDYVYGVISSDDGRVVTEGRDINGYEFLLMHQGATKTMVLHSQVGYPAGTNQPNNLVSLTAGGVTTNGEVLFTANRYIYTDVNSRYNAGISLFKWSNGTVNEILPPGGSLGGGFRLTRASASSMNARGDIALLANVTNSLGEYRSGLFRKMASGNVWEEVALNGDLSPSGVIDQVANNFSLNNAGSILFSTVINGNYAHLISRLGAPLANFRPGQDTSGVYDLTYDSFNRYEESVTVPGDYASYTASQVEFFCPRSSLINSQTSNLGLAFDFVAPITNRLYAVLSSTNVAGPWLPWTTNYTATTSLKHFIDANPSGTNAQRFFRAERIP